jgi:phenylalanyl-tRNA synthetase beta chain
VEVKIVRDLFDKMANIKINKELFEKEIGNLTEELQNKIALFGTTVESVNEEEIELDITPDRPDLLSYQGFKRSFLGFIGKEKGLKEYKINPPEKDYVVTIDKSLKEIRPYTACAIVKGLNFNEEKIKEIIDIQEKLHSTVGRKRKKLAIGVYPLDKIKLPITFKALEPDQIKFQPLESPREMTGLQILQRHPTGREYAHLLAGKSNFPIFIDANNEILSMPPIINSHKTGKITQDTKDIFIECSGFDLETCKKCLNMIVTTLADMEGKIYQMNIKGSIKEKTPNLNSEENKISLENTNKLLGLELTEKQLKKNLEKMGHNYSKGKVQSPAWRTDLLHEVDLIEDIAIAYGYENFKPEIPEISTIGKEDKKETIKRKIAEILTGIGFLEVSNYHLTKRSDQFLKMGIQENQIKNQIEVEESKTEYNLLRKDLSHYILRVLSENIDSEYPQKIFETGKIFKIKENKIKEKENLSMAIAPGNFTVLKQSLEYLGRMLNLEIQLKEQEKQKIHFIEGRTADIYLENKIIGQIGEIHPRILRNWKIKMPVALIELELEEIFKTLE